jgi:DNA-binding transcriptional regulator YiaG
VRLRVLFCAVLTRKYTENSYIFLGHYHDLHFQLASDLQALRSLTVLMPKTLSPVVARLRSWREANALSQAKAAKILADAGFPVKLRTLQDWEIGRSSPHALTGVALERFLSQQDQASLTPPKKSVASVIERFKAWRESNNLSQLEAVDVLLAAGLPANIRTLQAWEIGRHSPQAITAAALELFLDEHRR